jgi:hypothetical protein
VYRHQIDSEIDVIHHHLSVIIEKAERLLSYSAAKC